MSLDRPCRQCGKPFEAVYPWQKTCGDEVCRKLDKCSQDEKRCRKKACRKKCKCGRRKAA